MLKRILDPIRKVFNTTTLDGQKFIADKVATNSRAISQPPESLIRLIPQGKSQKKGDGQ